MDVKVVIDGKETRLVANGESDDFFKFKEAPRTTKLIASVYVRKKKS